VRVEPQRRELDDLVQRALLEAAEAGVRRVARALKVEEEDVLDGDCRRRRLLVGNRQRCEVQFSAAAMCHVY